MLHEWAKASFANFHLGTPLLLPVLENEMHLQEELCCPAGQPTVTLKPEGFARVCADGLG